VLHVDPLLGVGQKLELLGIDHVCVRVCSCWIYWMHSSAWLIKCHFASRNASSRAFSSLQHLNPLTPQCPP
jgi:hypothetical protein